MGISDIFPIVLLHPTLRSSQRRTRKSAKKRMTTKRKVGIDEMSAKLDLSLTLRSKRHSVTASPLSAEPHGLPRYAGTPWHASFPEDEMEVTDSKYIYSNGRWTLQK